MGEMGKRGRSWKDKGDKMSQSLRPGSVVSFVQLTSILLVSKLFKSLFLVSHFIPSQQKPTSVSDNHV